MKNISQISNAVEAPYVIISKVAKKLNANGLTIRKMLGEDLDPVIENFNRNAHSLYMELLKTCPGNVKRSKIYATELLNLTPVIEAGIVRLKPKGSKVEKWNHKSYQ